MFYRIYTYRLVLFFGLLGSFQNFYSQSESQLLKKSNSFFSKDDYRNAINGYRQLLSNDIKNIDYNFKYAVCLFYTKSPNSSQKYFDYLLNQEGFPIDVFYFKGRLYHLNYQFERAIEMYENYVKIKTSKNQDYHCLDEIKRCQNAISLLKSPRAIEVISMKKMSQENYFSSYIFDSENFKLYSNTDVFSKVNQKNGFVPKYVFKRGMKYRFFASYSKLESAKKDIFIQQKDSNNEWKEPVRLGLEINSSFNEDFPFFDESTGYLYFSSDGHSSIGGMDVFRVRFNLKNLTFGTIENLNFPYSSTYDDFLYIPIESASYVYFTTNRNSDIGSVEVVKSKLSDREVPTFVSRLIFIDEVNEENTSAQFYLTNRMSKDKFGPFNTNESGFVNILIPAPGIYKLTAVIEGSDQEFEEDINFPPKVEGYDYQVECSYKLQDSKEILLFDEQLTDQSSLISEVNVIDFQEFSKLIVNSESIKANEVNNENKEVEELSQEAIDAKIDELYDIEAEIEDQIRQKTQVAKNIVKAKTTLASIDKKIKRINENIELADYKEKESLQKELRDSFVKRKALIDNYNEQIELYDNFRSDEELESDYFEIANINKSVSEKSFAGQTDSVRSILTAYNTPKNHKPLIPSVPDMARARQDKLEDDFKTTESNIDVLKSEIIEEINSIIELKDQMSEVSSIQDWESLKDSVKQIETKVSNKIKEKQSLELEREELSEKIIFSEESLLNLTLIETGINEQDSIDIKDFTITEEEQVKFYADEIYINKVIDEQQVLAEISDGREESLSQISSTNLPIEVKDSLALITENEFIELINLKVDETLTESNDELNELIQLSQNNIEEIVEKNQELASISTDRNESTEADNAPESNTNTENNTEELNTRSSEEERSTETLAERNESTEAENAPESNTNTENNTEELNTRSSEEERSTETLAERNESTEAENAPESNTNTENNTEELNTRSSEEERSTETLAERNESTEAENAPESNTNTENNTEELNTRSSEEERSTETLAERNESTEAENAPESNTNTENNTEELNTRSSEEERSTETLAERNESTEAENAPESNTNTENNTEELNTRSSEEERSTETLAERNESTEAENAPESNTNTENNTEELNTRSSEEERSTETLAERNESTEAENAPESNTNTENNTEELNTRSSEEERSTETLAERNESTEAENAPESNTNTENNTEELNTRSSEEERSTETLAERNESTEAENAPESNTNTENNTEELNTRSSEEERSTETLAERNESTEAENAPESNTNTENNTEELNTRSSEEERSTETLADENSNEVVVDLVQGNSKSVEYLTSLVLEESMGDVSAGKSNKIKEIELNETDLKEYFKKELDIAIANEKIENKYVKLKSRFPDVMFEGKSNIEAQLRELKIKEKDLQSRMKSASSNNVKSLIAQLIDANKRKIELLEIELEELNELDYEKLKIESVQTSAKSKAEIQRTNAYYTYVLERDKIESDNQLLEELLVKNEDVMLNLDRSLRDNLNSNDLTQEQSEKIKAMADIQEAIAYLKQNIELNKSNIVQDQDAKSFEYLYQSRINPIVDSKSVKSIEKNTIQINELTNVLNVSLKQSKETVQDFSPKSESFKSYIEKRALLNLKTEELEQLIVNNSNASTSEVEDSQIDGYLYVNEVKKDKISGEIISIVNEMNSIDSSELFESYINNRISNNSLTSSTRLNQSILDVVPPNNSERNSFVVLEEKIIVENKATLPILETNPSGLNFRVQVGAFRRPVREDVYREFTPVSGQQLNNGLIVYMAGYFNNSNDAVTAQKSIRSIGYSDAFIVSYCNDERLPYWKGKEYERNGECLASARNEPIAINSSIENNNSDLNSKGNGVSNQSEVNTAILSEKDNSSQENVITSINSNIEQHGNNVVRTINVKGLFYSVQVGAFNRKIRGSELSQIEELNYYRSSGLYRYSSGKFDSIEKARDRQKAVVSLGISDAFIVAYYNGERISIQKSRNLISENGNAILFDKEIQSVLNGSIQDNESTENNQSINSEQEITQVSRPIEIPIIGVEEEVEKVMMVSYTFNSESFEEGTIERLNRIGVFNYNENDANITSSIINTSELTPIMSFYMKGMEENEFISEEFIEYRIELGSKIPGKLANWILRTNKTFRFIVLDGVNHLIFYVNNEIEKTELRDELNEMLK